jgi:hypothetical protein
MTAKLNLLWAEPGGQLLCRATVLLLAARRIAWDGRYRGSEMRPTLLRVTGHQDVPASHRERDEVAGNGATQRSWRRVCRGAGMRSPVASARR